MLSPRERREIFSACPWIQRLDGSDRCTAYKWSHMPLKAIYTRHGKPPTGMEPYRCKNQAWWKFNALRVAPRFARPARDGSYCWIHLIYEGIHYNEREQRRFEQWFERWMKKHEKDI